jgi:adenylylsulfate kinase-like enzyme
MIIVLFGQPGSGKTTLAKELLKHKDYHHIDGDDLREIFNNKDYSRKGRIKNLNRASDIAQYLSREKPVILSLIYPYQEARDYLNSLNSNVKWCWLKTDEQRKEAQLQVKDFENPIKSINSIEINTNEPIRSCLLHLLLFLP